MIDGQAQGGGDFRAILHAAKEIDGAADTVLTGGAPSPDAGVEVLDPAAAWAEIPAAVGQVLCLAMPELKDAYNPKACLEWGKAMARLAAKRQWSADGFPPEVSVGLASLGFVVPTLLSIKLRRDHAARAKAAQAQAAGDSQQTTGAESVGQAV